MTWQEPQKLRVSVYSKLAMFPVSETMPGKTPSPSSSMVLVSRLRWGRRTRYQAPMRMVSTAQASEIAWRSCSVVWMVSTGGSGASLHDDRTLGDLRWPGDAARCVGLHPLRSHAVGLDDALARLEQAERGPPAV